MARKRKELESTLEARFVNRMEILLCEVPKTEVIGRGWPDRAVLAPGGIICWVELKRAGEEPSPLQRRIHRMLRAMGFTVFVVDCNEDIDDVEEWVIRRMEVLA